MRRDTDGSGSFAGSGVSEFLKSRNLPAAVLERLDDIFHGAALPGSTGRKHPEVAGKQTEQISKKAKSTGFA